MRTHHPRRSVAVMAVVAILAALLAGGATSATADPAPAQTLPELGHWRNHHPGDTVEDEGWQARMEAAEATYGNFSGHWRNYHEPGDPPMDDQEIAAAQAGESLHLSWKPRPAGEGWAYTASGAYDDTIDSVMTQLRDSCGQDCWLSLEIEPESKVNETEGSGFTTEDFRGLWERVADSRERVGADNVQLVWVLQGYEQWRPLYADLWPGNDVVDIVGHDPYIGKNTAPELLGQRMIDRTTWLVENSTAAHDYASKPLLIAEYGCDLNSTGGDDARGTEAHRAACLNGVHDVLDELGELGVVEMEFFDARSDWLNDPPAADGQAYQQLKTTTEAG
jgi:hypothetical protein